MDWHNQPDQDFIVKKAHRKVHFYLWLALFPLLLILLYIGTTGIIKTDQHVTEVPESKQGGKLP